MNDSHGTGFSFSRTDFPTGFEFGTATSAYQIEGSEFDGCGVSHWDTFAATAGNVAAGESGARACEHIKHWPQDLDLVSACGFDAYRFSTSRARVMPTGQGAVNQAGLDFYDRLVDGLLERRIKPYACLYHWELPAALADKGGWCNRDVAGWFTDFTEVVMRRLGDRLHGAATFNEPWCIAWLGHFLGLHAPGLRDIRSAARTMHHVLLAHGNGVAAMRALGMQNLGVIVNFEYAMPADDSAESHAAADLYDGIYNRWCVDGLFKAIYPETVVSGLGHFLPPAFEKDFAAIAAPLDWFGINYYTRKLIAPSGSTRFPAYQEVEGPLPKTEMGWEIYPEGLRHFILRLHREYSKELPLYVTENGMAAADVMNGGGAVNDIDRINYVDRHLAAIKSALIEGAPVNGYFVWSLLDNFEWALGYSKRFGLVHVDFDDSTRTPKASYHALQQALCH